MPDIGIGPFASKTAVAAQAKTSRGLMGRMATLGGRIAQLESLIVKLDEALPTIIDQHLANAHVRKDSSTLSYGLQLALCVATDDPLKEGRVRFWHPGMHNEIVPSDSTDWAKPISVLGGFDDCGAFWPPPAGSLLALMFLFGNRNAPFYVGTIWNRDRDDPATFGIPLDEYELLWAGRRGGYLFGNDPAKPHEEPKEETQVLPPSNTESYNGFDINDIGSPNRDQEAQKKTTWPNIYQIKTPQKHTLKFVDGNAKCNLRWKRVELISSRNNILLMKDDHLHPTAQWCNPKMNCGGGGDVSSCGGTDPAGNPITESPVCCKCGDQLCPGGPTCPAGSGSTFANPFAKHRSEQSPYCGPKTPHNPKPSLPQSGIWLQTVSGHRWYGDDSVEDPTGLPSWDLPWGFGCKNRYLGKTVWGSATGHTITLNDLEDAPENRGDENGIFMETAAGNIFNMNDHTVNKKLAGVERGVLIRTTSRHQLQMADIDNSAPIPTRTNGGVPVNKAKKAFVQLRSGYGLMLRFSDDPDQEHTGSQTIQLLAPHLTDKKGSHLLQMQLGGSTFPSATSATVAGVVPQLATSAVILRSGNMVVYSSRGISVEVVGDEDMTDSTAHKFVAVKGHHLVQSEGIYLNQNKLAFIKSKDYIILGAGEDCVEKTDKIKEAQKEAGQLGIDAGLGKVGDAFGKLPADKAKDKKQPCFYPMILAKDAWPCPLTGFIHFGLHKEGKHTYNAMSNRCFATSNPEPDKDKDKKTG